jgi:DNA-binding NtrC family response regulator
MIETMNSRPCVLFVDDEERILRSMRALFRRDYEVLTTHNPTEVEALVKAHHVDVVVSDQRMPEMTGIQVLRQVKGIRPQAMRVLLTGYSDLKAIIGSINEGEVFRFVSKPWVNDELKAVVGAAARIAREMPAPAEIEDPDMEPDTELLSVLVVESDPNIQTRLREILWTDYRLRFAHTADEAMQVLEGPDEIGVVISETHTKTEDVTSLIKALKRYHPQIVTVVITERADARAAIDLINEGQVYRLLLKPVKTGMCKLSVDSAFRHHLSLKREPDSMTRYQVLPEDESYGAPLHETFLDRVKKLPNRLLRH